MAERFPSLAGWEATRDTLHGYLKAISAVPRALADPHPKWWHISFKVETTGAATDPIPYPDQPAANFQLRMNLQSHSVDIRTSRGDSRSLSMFDALTTSDFAERLLAVLSELGIEAPVERDPFVDDSPCAYDPAHAAAYQTALVGVNQVLTDHRASLPGETGPVQLWPHNFDLAFEWSGSLTVTREQAEGPVEHPSQINFGFAPGDASHPDPYFYSNPWPFAEQLTDQSLPSGARWFTESWQGSLLPYASMVGEPAEKLRAYFRAVYEAASPLLSA